jgi:hypothetical protein
MFVLPHSLHSSDMLTLHQTDGLCDNVFGSEMLALCTLAGRAGGTDEQQVQAITDNFVHYARACMVNDHRSGPWARESFSAVKDRLMVNTSSLFRTVYSCRYAL